MQAAACLEVSAHAFSQDSQFVRARLGTQLPTHASERSTAEGCSHLEANPGPAWTQEHSCQPSVAHGPSEQSVLMAPALQQSSDSDTDFQ